MPRLLALLLLLSVSHAVAQSPDEPPPADGEPDARLWKEPCDLDGKGGGELLRISESTRSGNMSQASETYRVHLGKELLVELTQQAAMMFGGAEIRDDERWSVTCSRGAIRIRSDEAEIRLTVAGKAAAVDAKWLKALGPGRAGELTLARARVLGALVDAISETPIVGGLAEASARVGLLHAERAIDAGETDEADTALEEAEAGKHPALAAWARRVKERLEAVRGAAPVRVLNPIRIGAVQRAVTVPVGEAGDGELSGQPDVFWAGARLCLQGHGEHASTMRCYDTATRSWGEPVPYASPFTGGPKISVRYRGYAGGYATRIAVADGTGEREAGDFHSPWILARDTRGGLVIRSSGTRADEKDTVSQVGYAAAAGVGSVLAGGGKYFFEGPTSLRSVAQPGRSWNVSVPGKETGVACVSEPLTSPDEQRAACLAAKGGAPASPADLELWVFELAEGAAGK